MISTFTTDLPFKGKRTYLHGTDIINATSNFAKEVLNGELILIAFKKLCATQLTFYVATDKNVLPEIDFNLNGIMIDNVGEKYYFNAIESGTNANARSIPYDEDKILCNSIFDTASQSITLIDKHSPFTLIELIVSLNKHLCNSCVSSEAKWLFSRLRIEKSALVQPEFNKINVTINQVLAKKFVKSVISINAEKYGTIEFIAV